MQISMFEKIALESAPTQKYQRLDSSTDYEEFEIDKTSYETILSSDWVNVSSLNASGSLKSNTGTSKLASALSMSTRKSGSFKVRRSTDFHPVRYSLDHQQLSGLQAHDTSFFPEKKL